MAVQVTPDRAIRAREELRDDLVVLELRIGWQRQLKASLRHERPSASDIDQPDEIGVEVIDPGIEDRDVTLDEPVLPAAQATFAPIAR